MGSCGAAPRLRTRAGDRSEKRGGRKQPHRPGPRASRLTASPAAGPRGVRGSDEPHALRDGHRRRARESGQPHPVLGARPLWRQHSPLFLATEPRCSANRRYIFSGHAASHSEGVDLPRFRPKCARVGPRGTGANLRICRDKSQIQRRARPSVGRGGADRADCVRDLELRELEVSKQTAWQSVLPLALRTRRTVDADSERR